MTHTHTHIRMSSRCRYQQSHTYPMPWWWYVWWRARNNEPKIEETAHRVDGNIYQPNCEVEFYGKNFWCKYAHVGKIKTFISNFNSFYGCVGVHLGAGMQPYHRNVMAIMIQINGLCAHVFVSRQSVWPIYVWYNILEKTVFQFVFCSIELCRASNKVIWNNAIISLQIRFIANLF